MERNNDRPGPHGARRRRPYLISLVAAAISIGLLSLAGIFAQATDRATTGPNSYETDALDEAPDIDLQVATYDGTSCGEFTDDLVTGLFDVVEGETPPTDGGFRHVRQMCARNAGSMEGTLLVSAIDLVDEDIACTGREAEVDLTCGAGQEGELSGALWVRIDPTEAGGDWLSNWLDGYQVMTLGAGQTEVLHFSIVDSSAHSAEAVNHRAIQSDRSTWRFQLDLVADTPDPCQQLDNEPNDTPESAQPYSGFTAQGSICPGDEDWYVLPMEDPGTTINAQISLTFTHAFDQDLDMELYDSDGNLVAMSDSTTDNEQITLTDAPGGTYHVRVFEYLGRSNPYYELNASWDQTVIIEP